MSFVQFNLLPDVKLEFNKAQHAKRVVYSLAALAVGISLALLIISFLSVDVLQKGLLNNANKDIISYSNKLKEIPNLDKILTVQNQLNALPSKHQQKHIMSRLFTYLPQVTPVHVEIGKITIDTGQNTVVVSGTADSVELVNKFVDTLKFTNYQFMKITTQDGCNSVQGKWDDNKLTCTKQAFSGVILSKVDRNEKEATYTINASYDGNLFDATKNVQLIIPQETTTRSVLTTQSTNEQLFNGQTGDENQSQSGGQ